MKLLQIQKELSFSKKCDYDYKYECRPKPKYKPTYRQLIHENAILKQALKDASRIIAQDLYTKSK